MSFRDTLHDSPEFKEIAGEAEQQAEQATATQAPEQVPENVRPVVSLEKGDIEFWMQVLIVILLILIYRELARANGQAALAGLPNGVVQ